MDSKQIEAAVNETTVHPFERAGLGKAPFRYVGMVAQDRCYGEAILNRAEYEKTGVAVTTKPGGSCAYCGTYIVNMYNIVSVDGHVFHVGSDCVEKTADRKLVDAMKAETRKAAKAKRAANAGAVTVELATFLVDDETRAKLATLPHPKFAGFTLLDWAEWMVKRSGATGRAKTLKAIKSALADVEMKEVG